MSKAALDGLPPLRDVIESHGLAPRKSLGQNFLLDLNITSKIARLAGPLDGCDVIEVGPGPGGLTRALLAAGARVVAIERDERCLAALAEVAAQYPGRLEVIAGDALSVNFASLPVTEPRIVANLPYNIGTELLVGWLSGADWPPRWHSLTLMFQKEVAERIVAPRNSKAYGRLSVLAQWRAIPAILFELPPQAFTPPPKVTSAVISLRPRVEPALAPFGAMQAVTAAGFGQRRKMLRKSLGPVGGEALALAAGVDPTLRAESLSIEDFAALARAYSA